MKRFPIVILLLFGSQKAIAQLPVIDVTAIAEAIATTIELRKQVKLLIEEVELARQLQENAAAHLRRYQQSLRTRGAVYSAPLRDVITGIESSQSVPDAVTYAERGALRSAYRMYEPPDNPVETQRLATTRTMATMEGVLEALSVHSNSLLQVNDELEQFKTEIDASEEPRQIMDVQASLQVLEAREMVLTRQALMTLANLEAVRTAEAVSRRAQAQARYEAFIGGTEWLGDVKRYRVNQFLRMPGDS